MPYNSFAIANYFIELATSHGKALTPMKLQKLVYFAHGWHLAIKNSPLIDEQVEAWSYGPVIPSLYRKFREFGDQSVTEAVGPSRTRAKIQDDPEFNTSTKPLLDRVWEVYGNHSAIQLSNMTHVPGTPWRSVQDSYNGKPPKGTDIPSDVIKKYFRDLARSKATSQ